jgi:hypothetical protein
VIFERKFEREEVMICWWGLLDYRLKTVRLLGRGSEIPAKIVRFLSDALHGFSS